MRYDRRSTYGACIQACFAGMRLESILVGIPRSNVSIIIAFVIRFRVKLPDRQLGAMSRCSCRWRRRR